MDVAGYGMEMEIRNMQFTSALQILSNIALCRNMPALLTLTSTPSSASSNQSQQAQSNISQKHPELTTYKLRKRRHGRFGDDLDEDDDIWAHQLSPWSSPSKMSSLSLSALSSSHCTLTLKVIESDWFYIKKRSSTVIVSPHHPYSGLLHKTEVLKNVTTMLQSNLERVPKGAATRAYETGKLLLELKIPGHKLAIFFFRKYIVIVSLLYCILFF